MQTGWNTKWHKILVQRHLEADSLLLKLLFTLIVTDILSTYRHAITSWSETIKGSVSQDYKSWKHCISLGRFLERPRWSQNRQVGMTVSSAGLRQLIVDQQIFHCSSIAKSLLYSWELSCWYCVCTHSLERNPILRSNPQAEQSKRALLLYSAKPNWGGWGGFTALPALPAGSMRGENRPRHSQGL